MGIKRQLSDEIYEEILNPPEQVYGNFRQLDVVVHILERVTNCKDFLSIVSINKCFRESFWEERKKWFGHLYEKGRIVDFAMPLLSNDFCEGLVFSGKVDITHFGLPEVVNQYGVILTAELYKTEIYDQCLRFFNETLIDDHPLLRHRLEEGDLEAKCSFKGIKIIQVSFFRPSIIWRFYPDTPNRVVIESKRKCKKTEIKLNNPLSPTVDKFLQSAFGSNLKDNCKYFSVERRQNGTKHGFQDFYKWSTCHLFLRLPYFNGMPIGWGWMWKYTEEQEVLFQVTPEDSKEFKSVSAIVYDTQALSSPFFNYSHTLLHETSFGFKKYHRMASLHCYTVEKKESHSSQEEEINISSSIRFKVYDHKEYVINNPN